eukprot:1157445-Pelagomonas_calceolata.AAC.3
MLNPRIKGSEAAPTLLRSPAKTSWHVLLASLVDRHTPLIMCMQVCLLHLQCQGAGQLTTTAPTTARAAGYML